MTKGLIRADGRQLQVVAQTFAAEAQTAQKLLRRLDERVTVLRDGAWHSAAAQQFYTDFEGQVLERTARLAEALSAAEEATRRIAQIFHEAELAGADLVRGTAEASGQGGERGNHSSQPLAPVSGQTGPQVSGKFRLGDPQRPNITHDNGFTEFCSTSPDHADCGKEPTLEDRTNWVKYQTLFLAGKAVGHLDDGISTYQHYLEGNGADRHFDYGEYIAEDANGRKTYANLVKDAQRQVEIIGQGRNQFSVTSGAYAINGKDSRFPYPQTENWVKAIGAHQVWTSAAVQVTLNEQGKRVYSMEFTIHAEDRYNFNPGQNDIASRLPDRENGRFEVLGWAHSYMNYGTSHSTIIWVEGENGAAPDEPPTNTQPNDARREIPDR